MNARIHRHDVVDSSSERAFAALAAGNARHGDVHVARAQTHGRGRLGRAWHSAPDEGLYVSIVLLPKRVWNPAGLTLALGLATLDAVRDLGLASAGLKWPNDVVVRARGDSRKLAGCLVETRGLDPAAPHYVAGIGLNVAQRSFPPELLRERPVTSLALEGVATDVDTALGGVLARLEARLATLDRDPEELVPDFVRAAGLERPRVHIVTAEREVSGRLRAFSIQAGVEVEDEDGRVHRSALELVRVLEARDGDLARTEQCR